MVSTTAFNNLFALATIVIFLRSFPILFDVLAKISSFFALITVFGVVKNLLRKYLLNKRISPQNKAVLITGCDTGFGNRLAERLDQLGYHVFASCLFPSGEGAQDLKNRTSPNLQILGLDVTNHRSVLNALEFVKKNLNDDEVLWALVNNAGISHAGEIEWTPIEDIQRVIDVNTMGMVRVTKAFLPLLRKSKGRVVNTTSVSGWLCTPGYVAYCMSKFAAISFTSGLRMEMARWGVKAISIEPFFFKTPIAEAERLQKMIDNAFDESPEDVKNAYGTEYLKDFKKKCADVAGFSRTNLEPVIECFEDAITAEDPRTDYFPCYFPFKFILKLSRLLPQQVTEKLIEWQLPHLKKNITLCQ